MAGVVTLRHFEWTIPVSQFHYPQGSPGSLYMPLENIKQMVSATEAERIEHDRYDMQLGRKPPNRTTGPGKVTIHNTPHGMIAGSPYHGWIVAL